MGLCVSVDQSGYLFNTGESLENCSEFVLVSSLDYQKLHEPVVNPSEISEAFLWGFGAVVAFGYLVAFPIGIAKKLINKI